MFLCTLDFTIEHVSVHYVMSLHSHHVLLLKVTITIGQGLFLVRRHYLHLELMPLLYLGHEKLPFTEEKPLLFK